jgi:hypothetical protein
MTKKTALRYALSLFGLAVFLFFAANGVYAFEAAGGMQTDVAKPGGNYDANDFQLLESHSESGTNLLYAAGTIKNKSALECRDVQVDVNFYDQSGAKVGDGVDFVSRLAPGQTWKFKVLLDPEATKWQIREIKGDCYR